MPARNWGMAFVAAALSHAALAMWLLTGDALDTSAAKDEGRAGIEIGFAAAPGPVCATPGLGTTIRLRFVSTTTFFVRPWLKLCFT